jgi:predicted nuclease of predicted toxin-antitoxin system
MARFVLDEDVPRSLAVALRQAGHDASRVQEVGLKGASDREVFDFARSQQAALVTADVDLADARALGGKPHYGLVLLRMPPEMSASAVTVEAMRLLERIGEEDLEDSLLILEPGRVRIRRLAS